jgi:hypothetical protein
VIINVPDHVTVIAATFEPAALSCGESLPTALYGWLRSTPAVSGSRRVGSSGRDRLERPVPQPGRKSGVKRRDARRLPSA